MRFILGFLSLFSLFTISPTFAQNTIFELEEVTSYSYPVYPRLDLSNIDKIKIISNGATDPFNREVVRAELHFPNANNLIATGFKKIDNKYRAIVRNAWVFNHVIIDIIPDYELSVFNTARVKIYVGENHHLINSGASELGEMMYESAGILRDKSHNPIADSTSIIYQEKRAYIKLYQKEASNERGTEYGHLVKINHLGHGEFTRYIPIDRHGTAIAFLTEEIDGMTLYKIRYKDQMGTVLETQPEIINQLFEAF